VIIEQGKFQGRDGAGDTDRLADREQRASPRGEEWFRRRSGAPLSAKKLDIGAADIDFALGFRQRLALLGGEDQCEIVAVGDDQVEPFAQQAPRALLPWSSTRSWKAALGGLDRLGGFLGAKPRHTDDGGFGCRVVDLDRWRADPGAVDEAAVAQQRRIFQAIMQGRGGGRGRARGGGKQVSSRKVSLGKSIFQRSGSRSHKDNALF